MKPGVAPAAVEAQLNTELRQWLMANINLLRPLDRDKIGKQILKLGPGGAGITSLKAAYQSGLYMLIAASALVLLIACANLANLLLARGMARRQQSAVQVALGASRSRLIRSVLTESILLACFGGAAGLALAHWGTRAILLVAFRGSNFVPISPSPSLAILGFAFVLSLLTGIIFGVAPAWIASHSDPAEALARRQSFHARSFDVAAKVAGHRSSRTLAGAAGDGWPGDAKSCGTWSISISASLPADG